MSYPLSALLRCRIYVRCPPSSDAEFAVVRPPMPNLSIVPLLRCRRCHLLMPPLSALLRCRVSVVALLRCCCPYPPLRSICRCPSPMPNLSVVRPPPMPGYVVRPPDCPPSSDAEFIHCPPMPNFISLSALLRCRIYPLSALLRCRIYPLSALLDAEFAVVRLRCQFIRCPPSPMPNLSVVRPPRCRCRISSVVVVRPPPMPNLYVVRPPRAEFIRCPPPNSALYPLSALLPMPNLSVVRLRF
ncbi:unnamed protein product [Acanthosepion pharaonis]|uniref:Uncharacterized protein n=1 Tax=Acanthosepion pharaonis TaxID=158019 RepID=A0A812B1T8_ACAPH|nr:unnamed protein product [Sepia pharaonis]